EDHGAPCHARGQPPTSRGQVGEPIHPRPPAQGGRGGHRFEEARAAVAPGQAAPEARVVLAVLPGRRAAARRAEKTSGMDRARLKPLRLEAGQTIGLISPSGPTSAAGATTPEQLAAARARLAAAGFPTVVAPHAL